MATNKIIYFVVGVDLDTGTKHIDDDAFTARFAKTATIYNTATQQWELETDEEYEKGLAILNSPEWGND